MDKLLKMLSRSQFPALTILLMMLSLSEFGGAKEGLPKHRLISEPCGPETGSCSTNQGLYCDPVNFICACPEGSEWVQEHVTQPHNCRILPGQKCDYLDVTGPHCMGNYHCLEDRPENKTIAEGDVISTICKCGFDHGCDTLNKNHEDGKVHSDGPQGRGANHKGHASPLTPQQVIVLLFPTILCYFS